MRNRYLLPPFPSLPEASGPVATLARTARVGVRGLLALLCASRATGVCSAQYRASLQGIVTDSQGAVIPGATLLLTDTSTNHVSKAKSDGHGNYTFNALAADTLSLAVNATGFAPETLSGITLIPEQPNTVNVKLQVGATSESVDGNAGEVPSLDTTTESISGTVTSNQIQHMPSFDRDVFRLAALAPGTFSDEAQSNGGNAKNMPGEDHAGPAATDGGIFKTENNPQVIGNGSQVSANNILIDGISTSSANWGGASVITPSEESVEYLKVTSNAYDAAFGRFSGNAIQITSKSGGNSYHGGGFFKADRPGLNAYQRWNGQNSNDPLNAGKSLIIRNLLRDSTRFNQFGGSIGGSFWRDKLFGFFAYEGLRNRSPNPGQGLYETPSFLASAPAGSIASRYATYPGESAQSLILVPTTCTSSYGMPDGLYCKTLVNGTLDIGSPLKTALGNYDATWSSKTKPGLGSGLDGIGDLQLLATTNPNDNRGDQYNGRLDGDVTKKDRLSLITYWVPFSTLSINRANRAANQYNHQQINNAFTALENHTFSSSLLNEARASASGWRWNEIGTNPNVPFGLPIDSFVGVGNGTQPQNFGPPNPSIFNQWTYAYQDILTKVAGRHNVKAGATFTNIQFLQEVVGNARPAYSFNSFWDFLNDAPFTETANFNPVTGVPGLNRQDERPNIFGTFVHDDFKITPTLTLNLGLRWNYFGPFHNKQNNLSIVTPGAGAALLTGLTMRQGGDLYGVQKSNFGPQFGMAWNPDYLNHKVVFRGGVGINYNEDEFAITVQGNANSPTLLGFSQTGYSSKNTSIQYSVASDVHTPLAYPSNSHAITSFGPNGLPTAAGLSVQVTGSDQNVKTITVYHYSLDSEIALPHNFVATLGYQGSSGHHLLYQVDLNAVAVVKGYALNPALSRVMMNVNGANSNYNAMLATIKHNFSHGFQIEGQYTWSKSMDEGSSPYTLDPYAPISIHAVYGRSDYNVQNAFRTFGLYQPSFFHEKWLHRVADGWSLGGIYNWHTGFPWTPVYSVTTNGVPTGASGNLYYPGSPYSSIRPAAYTGTGLVDTSTVGFESGPTLSNPAARNVNFPNGGTAYFTEPTYTAAAKVAYNAALTYGAPTPSMERSSFNGSMYQDLDASLANNFRLPEMRVIGGTNGLAKGSNGWFWHFNDVHTGDRWKEVEISTSDCIWLLAGALTCRQFFHEDHEIVELATLLYSRYDFQWMTNGDGKLLSHGWKPEGHLTLRYHKYCQLAAMYLLGIGAPFHPLPPEAWYAWERNANSYASYNYIGTSLLWTYQYPFAWFDFRGRRESRGTKVDWFANCQTATRAHRELCYTDMAKQFPTYTQDIWGITSSSSPKGYKAWGGPPQHSKPDGSVIPCAAGGSLMLTPDICIPAMHAMKDKYGDKAWGKYGLADAFNPTTGWVSTDTLGLDVGMTLLSAENLRSGNVWSWFMANPEPQKAMKLAGIDKV